MGTDAIVYLPDGQQVRLPVAPRTWVDAGPTTPGDPLRAQLLTTDASSATALHRQRPLFQGFATLAQSIPSRVFAAVTGMSELVDNYAGHGDTVNTGRYYAPITGSDDGAFAGDWYLASGYVPFNSGTANDFIAGVRVSGGTVQEGGRVAGGSGHVVDTMVIDLVQMSGQANDYVELMAYNDTASAVNTVVSGKTPSLTVRWVCQSNDGAFAAFTPALPASPHTWTATDVYTADATGGSKVPLNVELRDAVRFLNNPPIARVTAQGTAQTIPNSTGWTSINFTSAGETIDNYGGWAIANPSRYTCQRAGLYLIAGFGNLIETSANSGYRAIRLQQTFAAGGTQTYAGWSTVPDPLRNTGTGLYATGLVRMAVGDYVEVQMSQFQTTSGAARTLYSTSGNASRIVAVWMAA
jgi:hypothetical protein